MTETDPELNLDEYYADLDRIEHSMSRFHKQRVMFWAVRWSTGFATIGVVVYFRPDWSWLWWAGAGLAAVTPVTALAAHVLLGRKSQRTRNKLKELEATLQELEATQDTD